MILYAQIDFPKLKSRLLKFKCFHFFKQYAYKTKNVMSEVCLRVCIAYMLVIKNVRIFFQEFSLAFWTKIFNEICLEYFSNEYLFKNKILKGILLRLFFILFITVAHSNVSFLFVCLLRRCLCLIRSVMSFFPFLLIIFKK